VGLHRRSRPAADRVDPAEAQYVFARDSWRCLATRFDLAHDCRGTRLSIEHVPDAGANAFGKRAPSDRWHMVAVCLEAQNGWCLTNRPSERAWLEAIETTPRPEVASVARSAD